MFERAEHLDLAEDPLGRDHSLEHVGHLLQRHSLARSRIRDGPDHAERAVPDHFICLGLGLLLCLLITTTLGLVTL